MGTHSFIESEDIKFGAQLTKFAANLPTYKTILGVTDEEVKSATADAAFFAYVLTWMGNNRDFSGASTSYKDLARDGNGTDVLGDVPPYPALVIPPPTVEANIQKRFSDLAGRIKKSGSYTVNIGKALGIISPESTFVPADGKPILTITLVEGGFPQIKFTMGEYEGIQLLKDSGAGLVLLNVVNHPTYIDKSGMPGPGKTAIFSYRAIYLYKGVPVGANSDVVTITVTG